MKAPQDSPDFPNAFYRVTIKGLCVRDGKLMMIFDASDGHADRDPWELPGGGLDFGENFHDALKREVQEEMSLKVTSISEKPVYIWPVKHGRGRGMDWYWVVVVAFQIQFEDLNFVPTEECREIKFFSPEELRQLGSKISEQNRPLIERFNPADFN